MRFASWLFIAASFLAFTWIHTTNGFFIIATPALPKLPVGTRLAFAHNHFLKDEESRHDNNEENQKEKASKREMLGFAIPALGIYLTNPLLSNIDNAFVGRAVGTIGLAALSPATLCTDQMLYPLFVPWTSDDRNCFTSLCVARRWKGNTTAARNAASARTYVPT